MKMYQLSEVEKLIQSYVADRGELSTIEEGVLGLGKAILHNRSGHRVVIITEIPISAWSSAHKIRMYSKMPRKYEKILSNL